MKSLPSSCFVACCVRVVSALQEGGLNEYLLPVLGIENDSADAFAKFDELEVRPAVKDPKMPHRAKLGGHHPEVLYWPVKETQEQQEATQIPGDQAKDPAEVDTHVEMWLYRWEALHL